MPTYDYACQKCGHRFEKFQSFSDAPLIICPQCGTEALRKVFSPAGIVFKGSGWYINDSRKSTSTTLPSGKSDSDSGSDKKETSSEKKDKEAAA